jgi:hypothetical protein
MENPYAGTASALGQGEENRIIGWMADATASADSASGEEEGRCSGRGAAEQLDSEHDTSMPRHNQEQQEPLRKQCTAAAVRQIECLVIDDLAGNACTVVGRRGVLVQQADAVEGKQTEQRNLDDPDAPILSCPTWPAAHAQFGCKVLVRSRPARLGIRPKPTGRFMVHQSYLQCNREHGTDHRGRSGRSS